MNLTPEIIETSQRLTSLFERNDASCSLTNVTNENDGRGYTCGWAGFTTADEEVVAVVDEYTRLIWPNHFYPHLWNELQMLKRDGNGMTHNLDYFGFKETWQNACSNPKFHDAYATMVDRIFGKPARKHCLDLRLKLPVAHAILFDSVIQHGNDSDLDGVPAMIARVSKYFDLPCSPENEIDFLRAFLDARESVLKYPHNTATREEWRTSLPRVDALRYLLETNPNLTLPLHVKSSDWDTIIK